LQAHPPNLFEAPKLARRKIMTLQRTSISTASARISNIRETTMFDHGFSGAGRIDGHAIIYKHFIQGNT
jgi:hypothetical protein